MERRAIRVVLRLFQALFIILVLFWLISQVDWERTTDLLWRLGLLALLGILGATVFEYIAQASMWQVLLRGDNSVPFFTSVRIDLLVKFINHLIPSKASGHSLAPLVLRHFTDMEWNEAVSVGVLNTALYSTLYGIAALIGIILLGSRLQPALLIVLGLSSFTYLGIGLSLFFAGRRGDDVGDIFVRMSGFLGRSPLKKFGISKLTDKIPAFTKETVRAFRDLSSRPNVLGAYLLVWTGARLVGPGFRVGILLTVLGAPLSPVWTIPFALIIAYSVTLIPVTPGGVGIAETSATLVFVGLGIPHEIVVPVIFLDRILGVYLPVLFGWYPMSHVDIPELVHGRI